MQVRTFVVRRIAVGRVRDPASSQSRSLPARRKLPSPFSIHFRTAGIRCIHAVWYPNLPVWKNKDLDVLNVIGAGYVTTEKLVHVVNRGDNSVGSVQMLTPMTPYKDFQGGNRCSFKNFASLLANLDFGPTVALDVCSHL